MITGDFAAIAIALYAAHHVGDYWVQRDEDARHKGDAGSAGRLHCLHHVLSYLATQTAFLLILAVVTGVHFTWGGISLGLLVSGGTHYFADRRTPLIRLASMLPGKAKFVELGKPRAGREDNPQLATGMWALDQSWHIFWGVFVAALIMIGIQ